ncbi:MAG: Cof-type HAD-IIB family hydrolase [Lawsonibacter sp.]
MTKAIFFDLDGTLVSFRTHRISLTALDALSRLRARGIKLFLSTGRHPRMLSYVRSVFPFDGWITLSGQYCYCGDRVIHRNPMDRQSVAELVEATQTDAFSCIYLEGQDIYLNYADRHAQEFMKDLCLPLPPVQPPRRALNGELYQAIAFLSKENESLLLTKAPHLKTTRWHPYFLDVIPSTGGKDKGMDAMLDHVHIPLEESMAFGDGENDLSMLVHAGVGIAMGTASDEVKAAADWSTGTVEEDGIVSALTHFGLL